MTDTLSRLKAALADRYAIEREIGQGGMATVYLAEDVKHHRKVAVKVLRPELAAVLGADRFLREIDIAAKLQHPHILTLIDSGEADGFLYYVMPFVDGESLRSKLARERELPIQEAVRIIREVVDALINAHAIGVVHRDIKPDNVLLSGRHAVVTDFGIAKAVSEATGAQQLTTAGVALGTPTYMAPEQAVADPNVDHRADIYAVGVMAYEMLAGQPPFAGASPQAVLSAHVTERPKAVTESRTSVSPELGTVIMKCLEKKPADRWQSAEELYVELEKLTTPSGGTTPVTAVTTAPARRRGVVAVAIAAGAVLAVAGFFALRGGGSPTVIASGDRLVVIPFAPTNEDSALSRLGRDLVVLLTRNLDGVGDIEVVDHTTVLAKTGGSDRRYSLTEAAEIGRELGAATVLHGTLLRVADQVVLDVGLFETDGLEEIARASAQAPADEHFALTDETTWALLEAIWKSGDAPTPSVQAITTRSWPALRAFLDGESSITRGEWVKAAGHYAEAIAADTTFWLAHLRYRLANGWSQGGGPPSDFARSYAEIRDSLPPREQLQVDARLAPAGAERYAIAERLISRYPNYLPGLLDQADRLNHSGPYFGRDVRESRELYQRILDIDPNFLPAYEHFVYVGIATRDAGLIRMAIDSIRVRDLQNVSFYGPAFDWNDAIGFWETWMARIEAPEIYKTPPSESQVDSVIGVVEGFGSLLGANPWNQTFVLPPDDWGIAASRRLASGSDSAMAEVGHQRVGLMWAARGAWDSTAIAMEEYVRWSRDPNAPVRVYRMAVYGVWLGALDVEIAREARDAVTGVVGNLNDFFAAEVPFLDGVLAASQQDEGAIQRALRELDGRETLAAERFRGALSAFQLALRGNTAEAGRQLAAQERRGSFSTLRPIARLAAADWLMQAGETREAERLLRWHEAVSPTASGAYDRTFEAVARLQSGRVAEAEGRLDDAAEFYSQFLQMYDMPTERHQHLRDEAEAALERIAGERSR